MPPALCVALDARDRTTNEALAAAVAPPASLVKVGLTAFVSGGRELVAAVRAAAPVFLDLKLHDIPAQVEGAVAAAARLDVAYVTVHAAGGDDMVRAAVAAREATAVLAVTILTSIDDAALDRIGISGDTSEAVVRLAELALEAGAQGIVCSPYEIEVLRTTFGPSAAGGPLLVVPGIRADVADDDQRRTLDPASAAAAGADVVVVGRPITQAADPAQAARSFAKWIGQ